MKLSFQRASRLPRWPWWAILVVGAWLGLVGLTAWLQRFLNIHVETCLFKRLTALPCPTCGATRGTLTVLNGHPLEGFLYNPLLFSVLAAVAVYLVLRLATGKAIRLNASRREWLFLAGLFLALLILNCAYLIERGV